MDGREFDYFSGTAGCNCPNDCAREWKNNDLDSFKHIAVMIDVSCIGMKLHFRYLMETPLFHINSDYTSLSFSMSQPSYFQATRITTH